MGRFLARILLPQGYPHTVAPNYLQYTRMRGLQYFFGGAIGVFSTRSLLSALGVTGRSKGRYASCVPRISPSAALERHGLLHKQSLGLSALGSFCCHAHKPLHSNHLFNQAF